MVLSDGIVHFLKIEKNVTNLPKLSCGFKSENRPLANERCHIQWNLIIKRSDITKPSYNKVILLVPALYSSLVFTLI